MACIKKQLTIRLDVERRAKLQKIAEEENRSLANMIAYLVKREIERYEKEEGKILLSEEGVSLQ